MLCFKKGVNDYTKRERRLKMGSLWENIDKKKEKGGIQLNMEGMFNKRI